VEELKQRFAPLGVTTLYIKHLAAKQDNEKNQIYLGKGLDGVSNLFPAEISARSASESTGKRASAAGRAKLEARIKLAWLAPDGDLHPAPGATIIDYFQYPEVRLSGFLKGAIGAPDALRRRAQAEYGRRILVLGLQPDGVIAALVLTGRDDPLVAEFPDLPELPAAPVLRVLPIGAQPGETPWKLLREELRAIVAARWHPSQILKTGADAPVPFRGPQGGGYTLEALLNVRANADKAPDRHGYEIKAFGGSRISLMTPTPDGGYQGDHSFREFMERYGRASTSDDGSRRFTGMYRCGAPNPATGLELVVAGYDPASDSFGEPDQVSVDLRDPASGEVAASWSLEKLANCWNRKHASALYITYERRDPAPPGHHVEYRYSDTALVGEGTDVWRLLRAIHRGLVFYDPADSIYADGTPKVRSQWRVNSKALGETMKTLYASSGAVAL
jgi:hypothetical protein